MSPPTSQYIFNAAIDGLKMSGSFIILRGLRNRYSGVEQHVPVVLGIDEEVFPLSKFLHAKGIKPQVATPEFGTLTQFQYDDRREDVFPVLDCGQVTFTYAGVACTVFKVTWYQQADLCTLYDFVFTTDPAKTPVSPDTGAADAPGRALAAAVFAYGATLHEEMWVYENACWRADGDLYRAVQAASWDDIMLPAAFKDGLQRDAPRFFASKHVYDDLGVTWKRGILLLGPPGNGKTEAIKAILKGTIRPVLYVKSFKTPSGPEYGVQSIFRHARKHAPCILVLEDLDAMVTDKVRSRFLNELDGLANNSGILTIATMSHSERIDDAILNRPSRFDQRWIFDVPDAALRAAFARRWIDKVTTRREFGRGITFASNHDALAQRVAERTGGFSFAFMKELFISFLLAFTHPRSTPDEAWAAEDVLFNQIESLSDQTRKVNEARARRQKEGKDDSDSDDGGNWEALESSKRSGDGGV